MVTTFMVAQVPTIDFDPDGSLDGGLSTEIVVILELLLMTQQGLMEM